MTLKEMLEKRAALVAQAQAIHKKAHDEKRSMTGEEEQQFDKCFADVDDIKAKIDKAEKDEQRSNRLTQENAFLNSPAGRKTAHTEPTNAPPAGGPVAWNATEEYRSAYDKFLRGGVRTMSHDEIRTLQGPENVRAIQADSDIVGGFLTAPQQMVDTLIKRKDDLVFMRQWATKHTVRGAGSLGAPTLDADPADWAWTSEIQTGNEDTSMRFGKRELFPHPLAKRIKVSRTLLNRTNGGAADLVRERLTYKQKITEEYTFLRGHGAQQPLGVFTPSVLGITTARDISTDNTTTAITADGLINAKFFLKSQYMNSPALRWIFHRDAVRNVRKLKDSNGVYLWQAGIGGTPDTILEVPYVMSEYAPNTFTADQYIAILGDFSYYWIADSMKLEIQRLDELYAETNQIGFIGRSETDAMPVLEEAFVRVKTAAA